MGFENKIIVPPYDDVAHYTAICSSLSDIFAEKVRALLIRGKPRDLYDIWFLLSKEVRLREDYIKNKMLWYKMEYAFENVISAIEKYKEEGLENGLRKFLPKNYRQFIKELKSRTLEKLQVM